MKNTNIPVALLLVSLLLVVAAAGCLECSGPVSFAALTLFGCGLFLLGFALKMMDQASQEQK